MDDPKPIIENEAFVSMMATALEDGEVRRKLLAWLRLNEFQRASVLNTFVDEMRLLGVPEDFIEAVGYLKDNRIAAEALRVLEERAG